MKLSLILQTRSYLHCEDAALKFAIRRWSKRVFSDSKRKLSAWNCSNAWNSNNAFIGFLWDTGVFPSLWFLNLNAVSSGHVIFSSKFPMSIFRRNIIADSIRICINPKISELELFKSSFPHGRNTMQGFKTQDFRPCKHFACKHFGAFKSSLTAKHC